MDKNRFIEQLKELKLIAHRLGYAMIEYPENSLDVLKKIFNNTELLNSCNGFEFDICFTKDNIPIVIHDKYIDDCCDRQGLVKNYTLNELKQINFSFRKSINIQKNNSYNFKIVTLEEILTFFEKNISLLNNKTIKIETKDYTLINNKNLIILAEILNKFPNLSDNIIHLCYWPLNLLIFKRIQKKNKYKLVKNDFLCDYNLAVFLSKFMPYLDNVSLKIKTSTKILINKTNSKRVNKKITTDQFLSKFSNVIKEKNLKYIIKKFNSVGIFSINSEDDINEFCKLINDDFFEENKHNIIITTNNPMYLRKIKKL